MFSDTQNKFCEMGIKFQSVAVQIQEIRNNQNLTNGCSIIVAQPSC
jgi:hypothetical protein